MNVNDFLGTHLSRLWITETFRIKNLSTFLSITAMSWPEPNEKADRSTRVQVQGQDGLSCQLVNAENCSLVRTCTREYAHHCPPRHRHHRRRRHLREKTEDRDKDKDEPARTNSSLLRQEDRHVVYWQKYTAVLTQFSKGGIDQWMKYIFRSKANFLTANSLHWPSFGENCTWVNDCFISVPTKFRKCRSHISAKDHTEDCNSVCV